MWALILRARCAAARGYGASLGGFPVEGVNVLASSVAQQQGRVVGRESQRGAVPAGGWKILQIGHRFGLSVGDSNPDYCIFSPAIQNVNIVRVMRPTQPAQGPRGELTPFLSLEVEQEKLLRVGREGGNISAVGRP